MNPYQPPMESQKERTPKGLGVAFIMVFTFLYLWAVFDTTVLDAHWKKLNRPNLTNIVRAILLGIVVVLDGLKLLFLIGWSINLL